MTEDIARAPFLAENVSAPESDRLAVLGKTVFALGHGARTLLDGWYPATLKMEHEAAQAVPQYAYRACGDVTLLEIFGACDPFKPKDPWHQLRDAFGSRVTTVIIKDASHALFPEQPDAKAKAIFRWLARTDQTDR